jgi:hypothetical protein
MGQLCVYNILEFLDLTTHTALTKKKNLKKKNIFKKLQYKFTDFWKEELFNCRRKYADHKIRDISSI